MRREFRVGDKVMLDPRTEQHLLDDYGSDGMFGQEYTIVEVNDRSYRFAGNNWHRKEWCKAVKVEKNVIGGEVVCAGC